MNNESWLPLPGSESVSSHIRIALVILGEMAVFPIFLACLTSIRQLRPRSPQQKGKAPEKLSDFGRVFSRGGVIAGSVLPAALETTSFFSMHEGYYDDAFKSFVFLLFAFLNCLIAYRCFSSSLP